MHTQHLGLEVPEGQSWIKVGGEKREWRNGKAMAFDTHYFHETGTEFYLCICGCGFVGTYVY